MTTAINTHRLFGDFEAHFNSWLKSQAYALELTCPSDYQRAFAYLIRLALVREFDKNCLSLVHKALKAEKCLVLESHEHYDRAWELFEDLGTEHLTQSQCLPGIGMAVELLRKGAASLTTHIDKSSELPQRSTSRDGLLGGLSKQLREPVLTYAGNDAKVLIDAAFGQALGTSVTMSAEDQAALGIVCSSAEPFVTSVGNAADAPAQQFFMIKVMEADGLGVNLLQILTEPRLDILGKMLGLAQSPTVQTLEGWLKSAVGMEAFVATLYFGLNYMRDGRYTEQVLALFALLDQPVCLTPAQLLNTPEGTGLNMIRLPVGEDYHLATPLINTGLLRDIHRLLYTAPEKEDPTQWRRMFTQVYVGGSKPQNAGSFFTAVMNNGRVNAFHAPMNSQNSGLRLIQKRMNAGRCLFYIPHARALEICSRRASKDPAFALARLSRPRRSALEWQVDALVAETVNFLASMAALVKDGLIPHIDMMAPARLKSTVAERQLILGRGTPVHVDDYADYLQYWLFKHTHMTRAEKAVVSRALRLSLPRHLKGK